MIVWEVKERASTSHSLTKAKRSTQFIVILSTIQKLLKILQSVYVWINSLLIMELDTFTDDAIIFKYKYDYLGFSQLN
jgi:hypothetical protein